MCDTMREIENAEKLSRKLLNAHAGDGHVVLLYAQWLVDAQKAAKSHIDLCHECTEATNA